MHMQNCPEARMMVRRFIAEISQLRRDYDQGLSDEEAFKRMWDLCWKDYRSCEEYRVSD